MISGYVKAVAHGLSSFAGDVVTVAAAVVALTAHTPAGLAGPGLGVWLAVRGAAVWIVNNKMLADEPEKG